MLNADDHPEGVRPTAGRAGVYAAQLAGYQAFIPAPLPPSPPVEISSGLERLLSDADRALGRLDGAALTLPNPDPFVRMFVRKEAVLSSRIEGNRSSLHDLLAAEARALRENSPAGVSEVADYVRATDYGIDRLAELPVSVRLMREVHAELFRAVPRSPLVPGELRRTQNWIGPAGCTLAEATFVPPPPAYVRSTLAALETFVQQQDDLPPLVRIGLAHAQFQTIHPFPDGNGRVGRLLITLLLCGRSLLARPVLYLSRYFLQHRQEYDDRLQAVRAAGDFEGWTGFFLRGVAEVSLDAADTARRVLALREEHRNAIADGMGRAAGNGHRVLERLYEQPIVNVKDVQTLLGTTFAGANQVVQRLVTLGILVEITGQARNRRFRYDGYVRLFEEEGRAQSAC